MRTITLENPHRKKHFDFFRSMSQPHFSICANVDITSVLEFIKKENLSFNPTMVYLISKTANDIPQFRWRIRGESIVEHDQVSPSFTVPNMATDVFSFCHVEFESSFSDFYKNALNQIALMSEQPSFEDEVDRDDLLFLSSIPWVSFTGLQHAMHCPAQDSVPRITWGKYFKEGGKTKMPLSIQAHHGLVDGRHMGEYFGLLEDNFGLIDGRV